MNYRESTTHKIQGLSEKVLENTLISQWNVWKMDVRKECLETALNRVKRITLQNATGVSAATLMRSMRKDAYGAMMKQNKLWMIPIR